MWLENKTLKKDLEALRNLPINWSELDGKRILITGSTGLIGSTLVNSLLYYGLKTQNPPHILAQVRNLEKAKYLFADQIDQCPFIEFIVGDITSPLEIEGPVDYIIHGASQTSSKGFIETPVETIDTTLSGTKNIMELAREKDCNGVVFLSTMEVYGYPEKGTRVNESMIGALLPTKVRNCYPLSKQLAECICASYAAEYKVPVRILRLTQTFGPGVDYKDNRVFAEFARCAIHKKDIVLKTLGETSRSYLYTFDAVSAILSVLLKGENGEAYTAANESTFCTIAEMAQLVAHNLTDDEIKVCFELEDVEKLGYANTLFMDLDTSKLASLGWTPRYSLEDMYRNMILCMDIPE